MTRRRQHHNRLSLTDNWPVWGMLGYCAPPWSYLLHWRGAQTFVQKYITKSDNLDDHNNFSHHQWYTIYPAQLKTDLCLFWNTGYDFKKSFFTLIMDSCDFFFKCLIHNLAMLSSSAKHRHHSRVINSHYETLRVEREPSKLQPAGEPYGKIDGWILSETIPLLSVFSVAGQSAPIDLFIFHVRCI